MSKMKKQDVELAESIARLMHRFEVGWIEGEMLGVEMLAEMQKFVEERKWMLDNKKEVCNEDQTSELSSVLISNKKPWEEFKRTRKDDFYGCVDRDGCWFDSGYDFSCAVHWCCRSYGEHTFTAEGELAWMSEQGQKHGMSIIHSTHLKLMYEKGLIK